MFSLTTKLILAGTTVAVLLGLGTFALSEYRDALKEAAYNDGVSDTNAENTRLSAIKELAQQKEIDKIAANAAAQLAAQKASNVEKAIADVRKANPACTLTVPAAVLDQLRPRK